MPESTQNARVMQFGVFEVDLQAGELRKSGLKIKLQEQPFQILALLLEHPGQVITREELRQRLWSAETFVDFDHSLNSAVKKLRQALGDDSDNPRFVETLPRRGYRLMVPVKSGVPSSDQLAEHLPARAKTSGGPSWYGPAILSAVIVAVGALALWKAVPGTAGAPKVLRFIQLTNDGQAKLGPMATDGSRIYFNEILPGPRNRVVQVSIKGGEAVPLSVPLKQPRVLDLSREGTALLIANDDEIEPRSLWVLPVAGESPRRVGTVLVEDARFGADGTSIIYGNGHDVYWVSLDGSLPRKVLTIESTPFSFSFGLPPHAQVFRFSKFDLQIDSTAIMEASADGTGLHKMFPGCCGKWTSDGRFFIFQNRPDRRIDLWALPDKGSFLRRKRYDKPIQLTAGPLNFEDPLPSRDGKEIFAIGDSRRAEVIRYDSRSAQFVPYLSGISAEGLAFSRDGQWVTYTSYPDGTLWRSKVDGSERLQVTFPPLRALLPRWPPDGKQIAFNGILPGMTWNVYLVSSEGGTPQRVLPSDESQMDASWSPDGNALVFGTLGISNKPIYTIDLRSKRVSTLPGSSGLYSPRCSPDGRYVAAITTEHPFRLMLFDFATQAWTTAFGSEIGYLSWSRDGKYIYFQDVRNSAQGIGNRIVRLRLIDRKIENVVDVKNVGRMTTGTIVDWFDLAPDDSPLFARDIGTTEIYALEMDWP